MKIKIADYALKYLELGLSVMPAKGKVPLVQWTDFQDTPPDKKTIQKWWNKWPDANIAIVCGKASGNLLVVDIDGPEKKERFKALGLPLKTWISKTARGWHVYYRTENPVESNKNDFEIKGQGSLVIAPPSVHPSGKRYTWLENHSPDTTDVAIIESVSINMKTLKDTIDFKEAYKGVTEGFRNTTLTKLVGSWFRSGMSLEEAISIALTWNRFNTPPLSETEIVSTVKSIYKTELKNKKLLNAYTEKIARSLEHTLIPDIPPALARKISLYDILVKSKNTNNNYTFGVYNNFSERRT